MPYSPLGQPVRRDYATGQPQNMNLLQTIYAPSRYNPNEVYEQAGATSNLHAKASTPPSFFPPFPDFPTPSDLGMGDSGQNRKVRFSNPGETKHKREVRDTRPASAVEFGRNQESKPEWKPAINACGRAKPVPPPPPPLSQFALSGNRCISVHKKRVNMFRPIGYKVPTSPAEEALRLAIIAAVKKLLRNKRLNKKMFKFICKHVSLNVFSILSEKKDISNPEKMVQIRMSKIAKLVDVECGRIELHEKHLKKQENVGKAISKKVAPTAALPLTNPVDPDVVSLGNPENLEVVPLGKQKQHEVLSLDKPEQSEFEVPDQTAKSQEQLEVEKMEVVPMVKPEKFD